MDEAGISMDEFKQAFEKGNMFASGISVNYGASVIVAKDGDAQEQGDGTQVDRKDGEKRVVGKQDLATNITLGMRMPSFKVLNQADARPWHFQEILKSDGRWRIVVFAGDISEADQKQRIDKLGASLDSPTSFLHRFTPKTAKIDSVIELLTIHSSPRRETVLTDFPEIMRPYDERDGWDYWKIYVDDESYHEGHGQAYENYGVDPKRGCIVVLRPDQYVSWIGDLEDTHELDRFFSGCLRVSK